MKCPRCELITSNNKDECPRCGLDFRPKKESLQISPIAAENPVPSNFSELVAAVDLRLAEHKTKAKFNPFVKPVIPAPEPDPGVSLNLPTIEVVTETIPEQVPAIEEIAIPEIPAEPELVFRSSSTGLEALMALTETIKEDVKSSSTDLQALVEATANLSDKVEIKIAAAEWKKGELEMVRLSMGHPDEGFFEVLDLKKDKEIPVLFELAEREILDPSSVRKSVETPVKKSRVDSKLEEAVKTFEIAQDQAEALRKLNISSGSSVTLSCTEFTTPASPIQRLACFAIDITITLLITLCYTWFRILPENITGNILAFDKNMAFELLPYIFDVVMTFYIFWIISQCVMLASWGSSIGGKILNIGITDDVGFLLTFKHSLLRSLSWSVTILSFGLGALTVFLKHKQTLHDRVAKTIAIKL